MNIQTYEETGFIKVDTLYFSIDAAAIVAVNFFKIMMMVRFIYVTWYQNNVNTNLHEWPTWVVYLQGAFLALALAIYSSAVIEGLVYSFAIMPLGWKWLDLKYFGPADYLEGKNKSIFGMFFYWLQFLVGPRKLVILADIISCLLTYLEASWEMSLFFLSPIVPSIAMEWIIYPMYPYLSLPFL
mmetsp:Transcript_33024/g.50601  ORF Transcript_33024/g.50601 Transcript_33024/m.50601 type:complete len:184 (+) Transcript_33024:286-837(+)